MNKVIIENKKRLKEILNNSFNKKVIDKITDNGKHSYDEYINDNFDKLIPILFLDSTIIDHYRIDEDEKFNNSDLEEKIDSLLKEILKIKLTLIYGLLSEKHSIEEILKTIKEIDYNDYINVDKTNELKTDIILICWLVDLFIDIILNTKYNKEIEIDKISDSKINKSLELLDKKHENKLLFGVILVILINFIQKVYGINSIILSNLIINISQEIIYLDDNEISIKGPLKLSIELYKKLELPYEVSINIGLILNIIYLKMRNSEIIKSKVKKLSIKTYLYSK